MARRDSPTTTGRRTATSIACSSPGRPDDTLAPWRVGPAGSPTQGDGYPLGGTSPVEEERCAVTNRPGGEPGLTFRRHRAATRGQAAVGSALHTAAARSHDRATVVA